MIEWWQRHRVTVGVGLIGMALGAGLTMLLMRPEPPPLRVVQPTSVPAPSEVWVQVSGAVVSPGVYRVPASARVRDAVDAAGGPTEVGDPQALNLASRVRDGQRVDVPERGPVVSRPSESIPPRSGPRIGSKIDLNRADASQLDALPGIGAATARRVLEYRDKIGRFERIEQLLEARLVNRGVFEQIKDLVTVE